MPFKIESLTAFVAVDENGDEGILGFKSQKTPGYRSSVRTRSG
jgi:hypothetical protein